VLIVAALVGGAGCAARPERLPQCTGKSTPINVSQHAGSGERAQ
jgi:hypothetical protein